MTETQIAGADGRVYQVMLGSGGATKVFAAAKKTTTKKTTTKKTATKKAPSSRGAAKGAGERNDAKNKSSMRSR